ncbi:MAG TPA: cupin domain-containing protein [Ktedonobacterales bacterium]|nr:cupin domain-containing protein [Ktedonobacterales bacterium]
MAENPVNEASTAKELPGELAVSSLAGNVIGPAGAQFVIAQWRDPGGPPGPPRLMAPLHLHHGDDEAWYVLEGRLRFTLGDREVEVQAGGAVFAPQGVPHTFWNPDSEPARYLLVMTPNIRALIEDLHTPEAHDPEAMRDIYRRHDSELVP